MLSRKSSIGCERVFMLTLKNISAKIRGRKCAATGAYPMRTAVCLRLPEINRTQAAAEPIKCDFFFLLSEAEAELAKAKTPDGISAQRPAACSAPVAEHRNAIRVGASDAC